MPAVTRLARSPLAAVVRRRVAGTPVHDALRKAHDRLADVVWRITRTGPPPPLAKRRELVRYAQAHGLRSFVETGTFRGDTAAALSRHVDDVYTIELSPELQARAAQRFSSQPNIHTFLGDSAAVLPAVLRQLRGAALCWLDAHWSEGDTARGAKDSPIEEELRLLLGDAHKRHVILIDDARAFTGHDGYPTIDQLTALVTKADPARRVTVRDDIIRIEPPSR